jgi:hypothetical protein
MHALGARSLALVLPWICIRIFSRSRGATAVRDLQREAANANDNLLGWHFQNKAPVPELLRRKIAGRPMQTMTHAGRMATCRRCYTEAKCRNNRPNMQQLWQADGLVRISAACHCSCRVNAQRATRLLHWRCCCYVTEEMRDGIAGKSLTLRLRHRLPAAT